MKRLVGTAIVLLLVTGIAFSSVMAQDCTVKAGRAAFEADNYTEALSIYRCAYDSDNPNEQILLGIGRSALMLNQYSLTANTAEGAADAAGLSNREYGIEQIDALSAALAENPNSLPLMTQLAHWLWMRARDDEAMPLYEAILDADPLNLFAITFRASSQAYLDQLDSAEEGFSQATELAPNNDHVYSIAATTYLDTGNPARAIEFADQAITLQPDEFAGRYVTRGDAYFDLQNYEAALSDYSQALVISPGMPIALVGQADAYWHLDDNESGLDAVNQALEQNPDSIRALLIRANLYLSTSEHQMALNDFARVQELDPGNTDALIGLGHAAFNLADYTTAADYYQQAIASDSSSRRARAGYAAALSALNDPGVAQALADLFRMAGNPMALAAAGKPQILPLDFDTVYFTEIEANAGDTISVSTESVEADRLDTALVVLANGEVVAYADDTNGYDAALDAFVVPEAGTYTVVIGLLDAFNGDARLSVRVTPAG